MAPNVSIAIPTFDRAATLERAVRSALAQTHDDLEIVVSDNASTDGTAELLARLAAEDGRLVVVRQPSNRGMVANIGAVLALASGSRVMLLSDDDWLAPQCIEEALAVLEADPRLAAVVGGVSYVRDGVRVEGGRPVPLLDPDPARRVRAYFASVGEDRGNTWMYALVERDVLERLSPMRNVLAFDWLRVAELAFCGPIATAPGELIFRELGGTSETTVRNVSESRLPALHARVPHLVIAGEVAAEIGWRSPVYEPAGRAARLALAASCALGVPARNLRHVAFHLAPDGLQRRWQSRTRC